MPTLLPSECPPNSTNAGSASGGQGTPSIRNAEACVNQVQTVCFQLATHFTIKQPLGVWVFLFILALYP